MKISCSRETGIVDGQLVVMKIVLIHWRFRKKIQAISLSWTRQKSLSELKKEIDKNYEEC